MFRDSTLETLPTLAEDLGWHLTTIDLRICVVGDLRWSRLIQSTLIRNRVFRVISVSPCGNWVLVGVLFVGTRSWPGPRQLDCSYALRRRDRLRP